MENHKFVPILFLLVGLVLGWGGAKFTATKDVDNYKADLRARATMPGMTVLPQGAEVKQLSGLVKSVDGNTLILTVLSPKDPLGDPALDERVVMVGEETTVSLLTQKDMTVFQGEMKEFQKKVLAQKPGTLIDQSVIPQMYIKKDVDMGALKAGQILNVTTKENVRESKSFTALIIDVMPPAPTAKPPM